MKTIILLIVYLFLISGCHLNKNSNNDTGALDQSFDVVKEETSLTKDTPNDQDLLTFYDETKKVDLAEEIIGQWYAIMGEYGNEVLSFSSDGMLTLTENLGNQQKIYKGTYLVADNKLSFKYNRNDSSVSQGEIDFDICGNILILHDWGGLYCKMGETPDSSNEYSKQLDGYYFGGENYYHFTSNGQLETNGNFYYYAANKDGFVAVIPAGASSGTITGTFKLDLNKNIISIDNINAIGKQFPSLTKITYEEYQNNAGNIQDTYLLLVSADALKLRNNPSLNSEQIGVYFKGYLIASNSPFETVYADGYTWYKVFGSWIADNNGEWVTAIR